MRFLSFCIQHIYVPWLSLSDHFFLTVIVRLFLSVCFCPSVFDRLFLSVCFCPTVFVQPFFSNCVCPTVFVRLFFSDRFVRLFFCHFCPTILIPPLVYVVLAEHFCLNDMMSVHFVHPFVRLERWRLLMIVISDCC